jgi:hypothetical protein
MMNMDMFFEFMPMILKNYMFKINLSRFSKNIQVKFVYFAHRLNKQNRFQVNEIFYFLG